MPKSNAKFTKHLTIREERNMSCDNVIDKCYCMFSELNDVALRHPNASLYDIEHLQNMLYEVAMEAACVTTDPRYNLEKDLRLLRMRQITSKF